MNISAVNRFWGSMAPDQKEKALRSALKAKTFDDDDREFYRERYNMALLVGINDVEELPSGFAVGIKAWLVENLPASAIHAVMDGPTQYVDPCFVSPTRLDVNQQGDC
ncbi:MAG TPA: hypothetical protein VJG48_02755 [Candidatus Paceibacterota bacterium]